jgi:parallel beta-helix repeat protein
MRSRIAAFAVAALAATVGVTAAGAATFTVTNTADTGPGSLRQSILSANATPAADTILFNIPGSGIHTIAPFSALPAIVSPVTIDGGTERIEISGASAPDGTDALRVTAGGTTIRSIAINRFRAAIFGGGGNAIIFQGGGGNAVYGCFIGTNYGGTAAVGNGAIAISIDESANNVIGTQSDPPPPGSRQGNVLAAGYIGVFVSGTGSTGNLVRGNTIGGAGAFGNGSDGVIVTGGAGNSVVGNTITGNGGNGILVSGGATGTLVRGNAIRGSGGDGIQISRGSLNTIDRNRVFGSERNGILLFDQADENAVTGNHVGTDEAGAEGLGNGFNGILVSDGDRNRIGGTAAADANVVGGSLFNGIRVRSESTGNVVRGNFVGILPGGGKAPGNVDDGIELNDAAVDNIVGGKEVGAGNVVSGNGGNGIRLADATTTGNFVQGNRIGTDPSGAVAVPNQGQGVFVEDGAHGNRIGGASPGAGNTIAFNGGAGVFVADGAGNAILGNSIRGNGGLGIDLAPEGMTTNDPGDGDGSPNLLQNFPVLGSAGSSGATTSVAGTLNSAASSTFRVEFFASVLCDSSGNGEARFFLGSADVATDAAGNAPIDALLPVAARGPFVAATATDAAGNTSEFSACVMIPGPTVSSASPSSGPASGGSSLTITGSNFQDGAAALVGGAPASGALVEDPGRMTASSPALSPGTLNDVQVVNVNTLAGTLPKGWLADFSDVPQAHLFHGAVEKIFRAGITSGCGAGEYCPGDAVNRAGMAVFLLRGIHGSAYQPPAATGAVFGDVTVGTFLAAWIERLAAEEITSGCGSGNYCPEAAVNRASMAVFLLRARHGADYQPPPATGSVFDDVPPGTFLGNWIEQLAAEAITAGCGTKLYCPDQPVTRGEMAVFLARTFDLDGP